MDQIYWVVSDLDEKGRDYYSVFNGSLNNVSLWPKSFQKYEKNFTKHLYFHKKSDMTDKMLIDLVMNDLLNWYRPMVNNFKSRPFSW